EPRPDRRRLLHLERVDCRRSGERKYRLQAFGFRKPASKRWYPVQNRAIFLTEINREWFNGALHGSRELQERRCATGFLRSAPGHDLEGGGRETRAALVK